LLGYHGVFAARSKLRRALSPVQAASPEAKADPAPQPAKPQSQSRIPWAELIRRVFLVDLLTCDQCGGIRDVRAIVPKPRASEVLERLGPPREKRGQLGGRTEEAARGSRSEHAEPGEQQQVFDQVADVVALRVLAA
jgi:hypothetical protein